jgi:hypothetical protein
MILPRPGKRYDPTEEARRNLELEQADRQNWKLTGDIDHPHSLTVRGRTIHPIVHFAANDATPDVSAGTYFATANTGATTLTAFDGGTQGQWIWVEIDDGNTTVDFSGTTLKGNGGVDWSPANGDVMHCRFNGTNWRCFIADTTP